MTLPFEFYPQNIVVRPLDDNTSICIKCIAPSIAMLYFIDDALQVIPIPDNLVVYEFDENKKKILKSIDNTYPLCFTDHYLIEYNQINFMHIKPKRVWDIDLL
jgi:hypothetical protein